MWQENDPRMSIFAGVTVVGAQNPGLEEIFGKEITGARYFAVSTTIQSKNILKYFYYKHTVDPELAKLFRSFKEKSLYFLPRHQILSHSLATYTATMVHDFAPLITNHWGKNFLLDPLLSVEYGIYMRELHKANLIVTNSEDTSNAVLKHVKNKVDIKTILLGNVLHGMDAEQIRNQPRPIEEPYFFYFSGYDYNKNIPGILKGYAEFIHRYPETNRIKLVFSGGYKDEARIRFIARMQGISKNIVLLDFVSDDDLPQYLIHSLGLVRLSYIEGCGLPEIEALSLGIPVISADIGAVREMVGNHAYLVDPHTPEEIAPILYLLVKSERNNRKLEEAKEYVKRYTWSSTAEQTINELVNYLKKKETE
jgi:glycosyltransferase involved in cell wall biosynthesis